MASHMMSHGGFITLEVPAYRTSDCFGFCSSCLSHSPCFDVLAAGCIAASLSVGPLRLALATARLGIRDIGIQTNLLTREVVFC